MKSLRWGLVVVAIVVEKNMVGALACIVATDTLCVRVTVGRGDTLWAGDRLDQAVEGAVVGIESLKIVPPRYRNAIVVFQENPIRHLLGGALAPIAH